MESPSKRQKFAVTSRWTQETMITSTPQRSVSSRQQITSPVSSILSLMDVDENDDKENEERPSLRRSLFFNAFTDLLDQENMTVNSSLSNSIPKFKKFGTVWQLYKPLHEDTLYSQVIENPAASEEIANRVLVLYQKSPKIALLHILQYIIDVAGFQNFDISNLYKFNEDSSNDILKKMETSEVINAQPSLHKRRFIFMETRGETAAALKVIICNFIQNVIYVAHKYGILLDGFFSTHLIAFMKCFTLGITPMIRHTVVVLVVKIMTALVHCYTKVIRDNDMSSIQSDILDNTNARILHRKKQDFECLLECVYIIFRRNCQMYDPCVNLMRVECAKECCVWVKCLPKLFITHFDTVQLIMKFTVDPSKDVRYTILSGCQDMLDDPNAVEFLRPHIEILASAISKRFYDVDLSVCIKAVDIFATRYNLDANFVNAYRLKVLSSLVFDRKFKIGEAACRFFNNYMHASNGTPEEVLKNLARLTILPGFARQQLLVEGALYIIPEIQDWGLYIQILLEKKMDQNLLVAIAGLFYHSVYQTLKGQSTILREDSRKVVDIDQCEDIEVLKVSPKLNEIINKYSDHPEILIEVIKIFTCIRNDVVSGNFAKDYLDLCQMIIILFQNKSHKNLLTTLIEVLNHLRTIPNVMQRVERFYKNLCEEFCKQLLDLQQPAVETSTVALKVSILYNYFNLNDQFQWENLFDGWADVSEDALSSLVLCCKWYLIWAVRNLTDPAIRHPPSELSINCMLLSRCCNEFTSNCFNMLQNQINQELRLQVYQCVCDCYLTITTELEAPVKFNKQFESLKLKIEDIQLRNLLITYVEAYIIGNKNMSLEDRRDNVIRYIDLVHQQILPVKGLNCILKYYHIHNDDYGAIIETSLNDITQMEDPNTIFLVTLSALQYVYEEIVNKYGTVDIRTDEARQLKLLAKQFRAFKYYQTKNDFHNLLLFAISYSLRDESKHSFLYFVTPFTDLAISDVHRKEIYVFFMNKAEKLEKRNESISYFLNHMQKVNTSITTSKQTITSTAKKSATPASAPSKKTSAVPKTVSTKSKKGHKKRENPKQMSSKKQTKQANEDKTKTPVSKTSKGKGKKAKSTDTETEESEKYSIHDSNSDVDISLSSLQIE